VWCIVGAGAELIAPTAVTYMRNSHLAMGTGFVKGIINR